MIECSKCLKCDFVGGRGQEQYFNRFSFMLGAVSDCLVECVSQCLRINVCDVISPGLVLSETVSLDADQFVSANATGEVVY